MAKKPDITTVGSGYFSTTVLNDNFSSIRSKFDNTLSLDGATPNAMNADLDMNSNDVLNVSGLSVASLAIGGVNVTATAGLSESKLTVKQEYNSVATMLADTTVHVENDILRVNKVRGYYEVAASGASDNHLVNAGGAKLYYRPHFGVPISATGAVGGVSTYPAVDQTTEINLAHTIANEAGSFVDYEGLRWRSEGTIIRNGVSIFAGGAKILFPSSGTYEYFKLDNGSDANGLDTMRIAYDMSGDSFTILGNLSLYGVSGLDNFQTTNRATVEEDLCGVAGMTGQVAEMTICGQLLCEGFAHWAYVPDLDTGFSSRAFTRVTGQVRSRFNLSPLGYWGPSSNALDDSLLDFRTDRCGGYGSILESKISGTEMNCGYFFGTGLTDKTASEDAETTTIDVTSGDATITLSGAGSSILAAGDFIVIIDAYTRSTDSAAIPLVAQIASKTSDTEFELEAETLPNLTDTGLKWFYRPPRISVSTGHFTANTAYFEGYWDCLELEDNSVFTAMDLKGGGVRLSGRHGAIINTTGVNNSIKFGAHRTMCLSNGLEAIVAYGAIRFNDTGVADDEYDAPLYCRIAFPFAYAPPATASGTLVAEVLPIKAVDPVTFFATNRTSRFGTNIQRVNVVVDYTTMETRGYFNTTGEYVARQRLDGLDFQGEILIDTQANFGSIKKPLSMTTSAATVYDADSLAASATYTIVASDGPGTWSEKGLFTTNASKTVTVDEAGGTNITFSGSTTNLQAALVSGSGTISFSIVRNR